MSKTFYAILSFLLILSGVLTVGAQNFVGDVQEFEFETFENQNPPSTQSYIHTRQSKEIEVNAILRDSAGIRVSDYRGFNREKCVTCHDGIRTVSSSHPLSFGCTVCHGGDGESLNPDQAHSTLIYDPKAGTGKRNPSSLTVAQKSCGQFGCHSGHSREEKNHIQRVNKSLMATLAGMISGLRFQWSAQKLKTAQYGTRTIQDNDGVIPSAWGALRQLDALPFFFPKASEIPGSVVYPTRSGTVKSHIADDLLRKKCFQCHIDSPPAPGEYRSQGCAACHFTYDQNGYYRGKDPTISRFDPGHSRFHTMTALPPDSTCLKCHKAFSLNQGNDASTNNELGRGKVQLDVHMDMGFGCIDCHTQFDIMGDGNLYSKQHQAVEIRCETCHGDGSTFPSVAQVTDPEDRVLRVSQYYNGWTNSLGDWMVVSARNNKMSNVKVEDGEIITLSKQTGEWFKTPLVRESPEPHSIPQHQKKLECTACHSQWVPVCSGCHTTFDQSNPSPNSSKTESENRWKFSDYGVDAAKPALMIGPRGKAAPMFVQPKRTLSVVDERGIPITILDSKGDSIGYYKNWEFTNPHGYSGAKLAYALNPHSVSSEVRSCASCHLSPQTLGLGEGDLMIGKISTGRDDRMESLKRSHLIGKKSEVASDSTVTPRGEPLAGSSQPKARPFNQEEINRILKVGNCIPCHESYEDPIYQNIEKSYAFEKTLDHRNLRSSILGTP